jgi:hypothetical protein
VFLCVLDGEVDVRIRPYRKRVGRSIARRVIYLCLLVLACARCTKKTSLHIEHVSDLVQL